MPKVSNDNYIIQKTINNSLIERFINSFYLIKIFHNLIDYQKILKKTLIMLIIVLIIDNGLYFKNFLMGC